MATEDAVIATNDDAAQCKRYAVEKGYWNDPYISLMIPKGSARHAPEINRGYFARISSIRLLLEKFIKLTNKKCQVINLGAGYDTTFWRLKDAHLMPQKFVEIDFPVVTAKKCHHIKSKKPLLDKISNDDIMLSKYDLHSANYHIVGANLTELGDIEKKLQESGIDRSIPTVFIAECVLVYIDSNKSGRLIKWISDHFPTAFFINYEQVNMGDKFGQVMMDNLRSRDCYLTGVSACANLQSQMQRFTSNGWADADALEMNKVYNCLPTDELRRIEKIEFMDERELMVQLFSHYCLVWAYKDTLNIGLETIDLSL
ncbi:hypothetical protein LOTGIDRAFT_116132 [Lottia gigantea]|uniref:Leucine carboxyl methyltransferase 1 n=1 Tax=Lottia gigantea TaxID=225164 RepID=V3ZX82_LOTGI|nr:hypothetical protein LOTGIDRAFT_116132 [Lottia gigantea]ESO96138.1 hypothetical protein LOTGIDRAFT_116132 [Lottia gigantea]